MTRAAPYRFPHRHLLGIEGLNRLDAEAILTRAEKYVAVSRRTEKKESVLRGRTQINLFFEASTRTQSSFEIAGKRLGADVMNMSVTTSSVAKGETLLDTAATLNAMRPDLLVVRHGASGAANLLAQKVGCAVVNAGDGAHEHPTQALLDALSLTRRLGSLEGVTVAIVGDIRHSRVARSNVILLQLLGARVRLAGPATLLPLGAGDWGATVFDALEPALEGADVVMMLRLQLERMHGAFVPSMREYFRFWGLDSAKLARAKPNALIMHPGPMNRGVEIASNVADDPERSLITDQVEMGVAVRMAVLDILAENAPPPVTNA